MSDMISNFVQQANSMKPLSMIGSGVNQIVTAAREREAARVKEEDWQVGMETWKADNSFENGMALYNKDPERWTDLREAEKGLNDVQTTNLVQKDLELMSYLDTGDIQSAVDRLKVDREAYANDNSAQSQEKVAEIDGMLDKIQNGQGSSISKMLQIQNYGRGEIGQGAMKSYLEGRGDTRDDETHIVDMIKEGVNLEFGSNEEKNWAWSLAGQFDNPELAKRIVDLGQVVKNGGDTGSAVTAYMNIKKDYNDETRRYKETIYNTQVLHDLGSASSGMADNAMITMINLVIDPATGVREAEAARAASSIGEWENIKNMFEKFKEGTLPPEGREQLLEAARLIHEHARSKMSTLREDYTILTEGLGLDTTMALGKKMEDSDFSDWEFRDFILEKYPNEAEHIRSISPEEMQKEYNKSHEEFSSGSSIPPTNQPPASKPNDFDDEGES